MTFFNDFLTTNPYMYFQLSLGIMSTYQYMLRTTAPSELDQFSSASEHLAIPVALIHWSVHLPRCDTQDELKAEGSCISLVTELVATKLSYVQLKISYFVMHPSMYCPTIPPSPAPHPQLSWGI